ncbi:MAG: penicillin-binding protein 2 [Armatimonadota bacterium]|nr:penicillin-binding protein 2 [Armatimonadota bacterium]
MAYARHRNQRPTPAPHPLALVRARWFLTIVMVLMSGIAIKLAIVQVVRRGHYMEVDHHLHRGPDPELPTPGGIYARGLQPMAVSVPLVSICANPEEVAASPAGISAIAREVATEAGLNAAELREKLDSGLRSERKFVYLARLLEPESVAEVMEDPPHGVWTIREYKRVYPGQRLACHVLGRRSAWHEPLEGAELRWSFLLAGRPGTRPKNLDRYGRSILGVDAAGVLAPEPGKNLVLTIDWSLQQVVEMALDDCMAKSRPKTATCVVMDPRTGEVLALASRPNFDPAGMEPGQPDEIAARLKNLPVVRQYPPGSLFKVLLAAATVQSPKWEPSITYVCTRQTEIGGEPLRCWDDHGHGPCDLTRMLAKSCNIAAARFALLIGAEHYHGFLAKLGFGRRTGIGLPGEASGTLRRPEDMRRRDLANLGFGQGVAVTDIQMVTAISAVVNGGSLMQPHIVRAVTSAETGRVVRHLEPLEIRRVCSEDDSARVREMMGEVVENGTGWRAKIEGIAVGGKTGTAQKWIPEEGGFVPGRNIVSFAMVAPLHDPRFVILVTADEPTRGHHGSEVAAPVARTVAVAALRQAGLLPAEAEISAGA